MVQLKVSADFKTFPAQNKASNPVKPFEDIAEGMEAGLTYDDCIITAYRDHCQALARGDTPYRVIAEMC
jgi:TPP-dependent pyruvate/acetoin dehydrogenase alpha subunit